ncbi:MAG: RNA polymerase sigma-70 factor [Prevotella sp.]|jgi:RNA polymerase sigma-70 factor (ECF subfamily)|nr:RNA polymerase sigma-70 factor [Prevotella sp.]
MGIIKMNRSENSDYSVYEGLFIQNYESLCSFIYSYVPDIDAAKDIVQDTFVALWQNKDKYQLTNTLLYAIAKNKAIDYIRANHQTKILKGVPVDTFTDLLQTNQDEESDLREITEEIWKYVETLPPQCKRIFILSRFSNLKNKEIAEQLEISVKAVEKQITKALSSIRTFLLEKGMFLLIILISTFLR